MNQPTERIERINHNPQQIAEREKWPAGPWDEEPDKIVWKTQAGLPGMVHRNRMGALCGYVAVSPGHPSYEKDYDDVEVSVHGGLTYADKCSGTICHVPEPGEPDHVWWLGFDCSHSGDVSPGMLAFSSRYSGFSETYRDLAYVQAEVENLAVQLAALSVQSP
jgi:hypothetical protein